LTETEQVQLGNVLGTDYSKFLTYPSTDEREARARIRELAAIGVTSVRFGGPTQIGGHPILGKGCVGIVTKASIGKAQVALKIRRLDADRETMLEESRLLRIANSVGVGPRLITATGNFLVMELFDGLPLFRWCEGPSGKNRGRVRRVLTSLLFDCSKLDAISLDHGELSHAPRNVLVNTACVPCIIDFESASTTRRVANVTSMIQYFLYGRISEAINAKDLFPNRRAVVEVLGEYKREGSVESFEKILVTLKMKPPR
jgi:putative serine/threonine protein kinase